MADKELISAVADATRAVVAALGRLANLAGPSLVRTPWLTLPQAARYLQMDYKPFLKLVYSGQVPSHRRSKNRTFVHTDDLDALMMSYPSGAKLPEELAAVVDVA